LLINEVAWAGTDASSHDEWIELYNPSSFSIDLNGWILQSTDNSPTIPLQGIIPSGGFFLLERTDDSTVSDIPADIIYTGSLNNSGETLQLLGPNGEIVDTANAAGGNWPSGSSSNHATMERIGVVADSLGAWGTNTGYHTNGQDAKGNPLRGTPKQINSVLFPTPTPSSTPTTTPPTTTPSPTPSKTPTPPIPTNTSSPTPTPFPSLSILINEIAWAGTDASANDEWIELYNPGPGSILLDGWTLRSTDGTPSISLLGNIPSGGYFLLERTNDQAVSDIPADLIYTGSLSNAGEELQLVDPGGHIVDTANTGGGTWPAGNSVQRATMERKGSLSDAPSAWGTNTGYHTNGYDANGNPLRGTPKQPNSVLFPTPTPTSTPTLTPIPGEVRINELLPHPRYDWNGDSKRNTGDEFIEIINLGPGTVNLKNWLLDDQAGSSKPYRLPDLTLHPGETWVFFKSETGVSLSDRGDAVHLSTPDGQVMDTYQFPQAREWNLSWCRLPDGWGAFHYPCWPTPGRPNAPYNPAPPSPTPLPTLTSTTEHPSRSLHWSCCLGRGFIAYM
jgi:hypothetical protein